jgi:crotonobetainyl-CoA:carnitine CoA-transferase CaiB-like acyl-CoA transferase
MSKWNKADLFEELAARRVVAGPVLTMEELRTNEHLAERDFWVTLGDETYPGPPFKMSETPWELRQPAPPIGANRGEWK